MKHFTLIFFLLIFTFLQSQNNIEVSITEDCNPISGVFNYENTLNGKYNYLRTIVNSDTGETVEIRVGFNGSQWLLYVDNDMTDFGFYNNNIPDSMLPPNTGWIVENCDFGTMIISGGYSLNIANNEIDNNITIYPNPIKDILHINSTTNIKGATIYNLLGKKILSSNIKEIDLSNIESGMYIITVTTIDNKVVSKKVWKK